MIIFCYVLINLDFQNELLSTIGQDKIEYQMKMGDGKEMKVLIWDTAGQERFHSITNKFKFMKRIFKNLPKLPISSNNF